MPTVIRGIQGVTADLKNIPTRNTTSTTVTTSILLVSSSTASMMSTLSAGSPDTYASYPSPAATRCSATIYLRTRTSSTASSESPATVSGRIISIVLLGVTDERVFTNWETMNSGTGGGGW